MAIVTQDHLIQSIADAFQYISCYHPPDFIQAMSRAYEKEESGPARNAIAQILINSRMAAEGRRPVCQDTGIAVVFVKMGMSVQLESTLSLQEMVDEGVRRAYTDPSNPLRASVVSPSIGERRNTGDNTPAVVHVEMVPGTHIDVIVAAKGGGSENQARFANLNPSDDLVEWVSETVPTMGAGWCPPGILGLGVGGTPEKAMLLAKESLMAPIDMPEIISRGPANEIEALRVNIFNAVNALGIGAQGLGGLTTVLDVKLSGYPTHSASLPVGLIPNCAATRHTHFVLDGTGTAHFEPPALSDWPDITWDPAREGRRVYLDQITPSDVHAWRAGETLLLNGKILTGRDAAHQRIADLVARGEALPEGVDFTNRFIYYVGPVDPIKGEIVGPAGPTTANRMDKFSDLMLGQMGLLGMIGKAERGQATVDVIKQNRSVYLIAVGGAAFLVSKAIRSARTVAFEDLGMEAIYEFEVEDMPVTVAVDSEGDSVHESGPKLWRQRIADIPVTVS